MNDKCYEIGTIQAFLDGETAPALSFEITNHTAKCDKCALALAQAEEENAQVFAMLDREMNTLVPTQRLWSNISVALAEEKKHQSVWDRMRAGVLLAFANPSISVAASVMLVFAVFTAIWTLRTPESPDNYVADSEPTRNTPQSPVEPASEIPVLPPASGTDRFAITQTNLSPEKIGRLARTADHRPGPERPRAERAVVRASAAEIYLPGEESYIRTIANLKESVDGRKDAVMSPSVRISYERDMAVVNDSINKMRQVVRKNPKNQAAKQVLYSSYQNKIDLLNSIVDREELMASMQ